MTRLLSVDWGWEEETLRVWDGKAKKMLSKLPKPDKDIVLLTENIPNKLAKPFIEAGAPVLRCSPNTSSEYREKYGYDKTHDNDAIVIWMVYHDHPQKFRPMKKDSKLKQFYKNYDEITEQIKAVKNRQWAAEDEDNQEFIDSLEKAKALLAKKIAADLKNYPIYTEFLTKIKGIGPALAAGLITAVGDISRFDNVSNLNAYFGVHVKDGACVRRKKGEVANWKSAGRVLICELIPDQFIKGRTPVYRGIYDEEKEKSMKIMEEDQTKPKEQRRVHSKLHAERRARRKVGKIFLHHFWKTWRELEGLPTPQPWPLALGGHSKEILPPTAFAGLTAA